MAYGPFGNLFPYSDQHTLNLDWIIQVAKDFLDQYTHIQDIISNGEESLDQHTIDGLAALAAEKDRLEGLLDAWYTTHSEDIANELSSAVSSFGTQAAAIVDALIDTIPEDYTALTAEVGTLSDKIDDVEVLAGSKKDISSSFAFSYNGSRINAVNDSDNLGKRQTNEAGSSVSGFVNIEGYEYILIRMKYMKTDSAPVAGLAFYTGETQDTVVANSGTRNPYNNDLVASSYKDMYIKVPATAKYIRTTWWNTTSDEYSAYTFKAYGIVQGELQDQIDIIQSKQSTDETLLDHVKKMAGTKTNITGDFSFTDDERIRTDDGDTTSSDTRSASGYVNIEGYTDIYITRCKSTTLAYNGLAFYSSQSASDFIEGVREVYDTEMEESTYYWDRIQVPEGAKYVRTTWWASDMPQYAEIPFTCYGIVKEFLQEQIDNINNEILDMQDAIDHIGGTIQVPDYYFDNNYLNQRISTITTLIQNRSMSGDIFFWFTDPHYFGYSTPSVYNGLNGPVLINYITDRINIRKVFCGGDLTTGNGMTKATNLANLKRVRNLLNPIWNNLNMIIGNHEYNNPNASEEHMDDMLPVSILYEMLIKDKEYEIRGVDALGDYYLDNSVQKIRYLFLGCKYNATLDNSQLTWVATQLKEVPDDYTVIMLSHIGLNTNGAVDSHFQPVANIINVANNKASISVNGAIFDYSDFDAEVACVISGHNHYDFSAVSQTEINNVLTDGVRIISTCCDKGKDNDWDATHTAARAIGTINEQVIDVILVDTENRKINLTRIGGSWTKVEGTGQPLENPDREYTY